jgi:TRAP transporter 4TM/12TM fusion protein
VEKFDNRILKTIVTILSVVLILIGAMYISNAFEWVGIHLTIVPYCALVFMLVLILVYLIFPLRSRTTKKRVPWYDWVFITMSIVSTGYITFFPGRWGALLEGGTTSWVEQSFCLLLVIAIIEATRRTVNLAMALIASFFVIHLIFGNHFPGILVTANFSLERIASIFYLRSEGIFGVPIEIASTIILSFMIFSAFLQNSAAGKFILDSAFSIFGRWKGGPAKAAIVASGMLGTMVGSTAANIASTGVITIPLMKKTGYSADFAGGVECVASNGGQIMPPVMGAVAFLIAELLSMSYWKVCVAAFFPALLYYVAVFVQVHFEAVRLGMRGLAPEELPRIVKVLKEGWFYVIPVALLLYLLAGVMMPVEHCGLYGSFATLLVIIFSWQMKKKTRKSIAEIVGWTIRSLEIAARSLLVPAVACASAGIIIGSLDASGLGFRLSSIIVDTAGSSLVMLLTLTALASFILGMGMTSIPCYLVLVILVAPAMIQAGVVPIAAHLFVFYWGLISFLTPPVAIAAYVACGISGGRPMETGFIAMRLAIVKYFLPFMFIYNPALLLIGPPGMVIFTAMTAIIGVFVISIGMEGFLLRRLSWIERLLLVMGGFFLCIPIYERWDIIATGFVLSVLVVLRHVKSISGRS